MDSTSACLMALLQVYREILECFVVLTSGSQFLGKKKHRFMLCHTLLKALRNSLKD